MPPKLISQPSHPAHKLLAAAHPPSVATDLFNDKIVTKPYRLRGTTTIDNARDARSTRRKHRLRQKKHFLAHQKPRPLSAKEKRESGLYDVKAELGKEGGVKYEVFEALNKIWMGYILEVLDLGAKDGEAKFEKVLLPDAAGPKIAAADFHGAEIKVVRSRCVGRVGTRGIVVRDTKFTFVIVTKGDKVKTIPKEHTIFQIEIPKPGSETNEKYAFELHGEQLQARPADRANKKFKWQNMDV